MYLKNLGTCVQSVGASLQKTLIYFGPWFNLIILYLLLFYFLLYVYYALHYLSILMLLNKFIFVPLKFKCFAIKNLNPCCVVSIKVSHGCFILFNSQDIFTIRKIRKFWQCKIFIQTLFSWRECHEYHKLDQMKQLCISYILTNVKIQI